MRVLVFLGAFLVGQLLTWGQTVSVIDIETSLPLAGVTFSSKNPEIFTVSNAKGQAELSDFKTSIAIEVRYLGYSTKVISFQEIAASNFIIALSTENFSLDEVVISASRWRQSKMVLPATLLSISPQEVALQNPQTAADLLGISGKVFIQKSQQGGGSPMIRGFATNRLIYVVDGVRMNNAIFRGGNLQNVINLDPFATESTEVLFGPGSVIYGSDAIGGVMSFQTLTPNFGTEEKTLVSGSATGRYASANGEKTGHVHVQAGGKHWAALTSFSTWDFGNLLQGSHGPEDYIKAYYVVRKNETDMVIAQNNPLLQIPTAYSQINLMEKVRFSPNANWDFQYGFHYSETSAYGRYDRHNRTKNDVPRYAQWDYGPQLWTMNNLSLSHERSGVFYDQLALRVAHQDFKESRISRNLNSTERDTQIENVRAYSANLDFRKTLGAKNQLFYGLEWIKNQVDSRGFITDIRSNLQTIGPSRYPTADWHSLAAYLNTSFKVNNHWTLEQGLRYNLYALKADFGNNLAFFPFPFNQSSLTDGALTGHIGGIYRPNPNWAIKSNVGTAFRAPNVDDLGKVFDSEPGAVTVPNPDLKAEYAWNLDLGIAHVLARHIKLEVSGYYTTLRNALVRRDFELGGRDSLVYDGVLSKVQAIQNAALARVSGIQASLEVKLPKGLSISTDLNWQEGEEELDDGSSSPSRHAAPFFGITRLTYKGSKLELQLYSLFQGKRGAAQLPDEEKAKSEIYAKDATGNNYAPAWTTLNLKARYPLNETLQLGAGFENITDQRYRPYSSGISGAGRNVIVSLSVKL